MQQPGHRMRSGWDEPRWPLALPLVVIAAWLAPAAAQTGPAASDDDLAVVKRAVAQREAEPNRAGGSAEAAANDDAPAPRATRVRGTDHEPQRGARRRTPRQDARWLRLRVTENGPRGELVSLRIPLWLAERVDDWAGEQHWRPGRVNLRDALRQLEAGAEFVRVDDEDVSVRVWLE